MAARSKRQPGSRVVPLLLLGWALVATVVAVGPERIVGWLGLSAPPEAPPPAGSRAVETYGPAAEVATLPGWAGDDVAEALPALARSCERLMRQPADRALRPAELGGTVGDWRPFCDGVERLAGSVASSGLPGAFGAPASESGPDAAVRSLIEQELVAVPVSLQDAPDAAGRPGEGAGWAARIGLFTGYFEPSLDGSRRRSERYGVPLHLQPPDLVSVDLGDFRDDLRGRRVAGRVRGRTLEPYDDRAEIASGSLDGRGLELVWVDDAVDAFFLQIQGSGQVAMDDGSVLRVGYAAQNGHPYHAIGRTLVERGELTRAEVSLQSIDAWLRTNPDKADEVMATNASYVFFRQIRGEGPIGAQGVALTPERSLAVDRRHVPLGVPVWLDAMTPAASPEQPGARRQWLLVAQDTGGAIRGAVRGDVFWGAGDRARAIAGRMAHRGRWWVLVPRSVAGE